MMKEESLFLRKLNEVTWMSSIFVSCMGYCVCYFMWLILVGQGLHVQ